MGKKIWKQIRTWLSGLGVALVSVAVLAGTAVYFVSGPPGQGDAAAGPARERPRVPVSLTEVGSATLQETIFGVGTLQAAAQIEIVSEISARVRAIHFEEGSLVEEGELLFELDDDRLQQQLAARMAALRSAEVREQNAARILERRLWLSERAAVAEEDRDQAQAELDTAVAEKERLVAEVALIRRELLDTKICAPFPGAISDRFIDRGAYLSVGTPMARLYQIDPLEMNFYLPERHLGRVRRGQTVAISVAAYPDEHFQGEIEFVSPVVDESTRQFLVKARVPNDEMRLKPGAFATAIVTVGQREDRPVIPEESLVATRRGYMVFVIQDQVAVGRDVQTGLRQNGLVEVLDGLEIGESVVREGHLRLSGGDAVQAVDDPEEVDDTEEVAREQEEPPAHG